MYRQTERKEAVKRKPARPPLLLLVLPLLAAVTLLAFLFLNRFSLRAERCFLAGDYAAAAQALEQAEDGWREKALLEAFVSAGLQLSSDDVDTVRTGRDALLSCQEQYPDFHPRAISALREETDARLTGMFYQAGCAAVRREEYTLALSYFREIPGYEDADLWKRYAQALEYRDSTSRYHLSRALRTLQSIPEEDRGLFPVDVNELIAEFTQKVQAAEQAALQRDEARIEALEAIGLPYLGMSEEKIHSTRQLGPAAESGSYYGFGTEYSWYDAQGRTIYSAVCRRGQVASVSKYHEDVCWQGDTLLVRTGPAPSEPAAPSGGGAGSWHPPAEEYTGDSEEGRDYDTGPGSGHSLRDDYSDPEDLFEDCEGEYEDLDEAWDEWEEGL